MGNRGSRHARATGNRPSNPTGDRAGPSNTAGIEAGAAGNNVPLNFSLGELKKATNKFNVKRQIGDGGSAIVYRGKFEDGQLVAVKRLSPTARRNAEYDCEVEMLTRLSHPNIINMIGSCTHDVAERPARSERIVVYEFMPLRSLRDLLHARQDREEVLDWDTRMRIGAGVAKGLNYLHNQAEPRVIFGDLKPADVLLGPGYYPKISDFGVAINIPPQSETSIVQINRADRRMTSPYWEPEAVMNGTLSPRTDVYSFGVLLLEIIIRVIPRENRQMRFVDYDQVRDPDNFLGLADSELRGRFYSQEFMKAMTLATLCMHNDPNARPDMSDVVLAMNNLAGEPDAEWPMQFIVAGSRQNDDYWQLNV